MSLVSSSTSVVTIGEFFFLISIGGLSLFGVVSTLVGGNDWIFLPIRASRAEPSGNGWVVFSVISPVEEEDVVEIAMEFDPTTFLVPGVCSGFVKGSNLGFSSGINFSIADVVTAGGGITGSVCV